MRKLWICSYSTTVHRLLHRSWTARYVEKETHNLFNFGPWELDQHDHAPLVSEDQLAESTKGVKATYMSARAKEKAALSSSEGPARDFSEEDEEDEDALMDAVVEDEALSADNSGVDESGHNGADDGVIESAMADRVPASTRARLITELKQSGEEDTYEDKNGKTRKKIIKFIPRSRSSDSRNSRLSSTSVASSQTSAIRFATHVLGSLA